MHPSLLILLVGLLYLLGFGGLSYLRRQGLSARFAIEGLIIIAIGVALTLAAVPLHPLILLAALYLVTMRVRLLVDLGNWLTSRKRYEQALACYRFALRLGCDEVSCQIVLINHGVAQLRMQDPEAARLTLLDVLGCQPPMALEGQPPSAVGGQPPSAVGGRLKQSGAHYLSAGYYNLGLACRRTGREAEATRHFNEAIDILPSSIYAHAARQALKKKEEQTQEVTT
jgi:tetratricopeptide (TPR) repeat protein